MRGQTTTEYIIMSAVVIVIASIVLTTMSGILSSSKNAETSTSNAALRSGTIGVLDVAATNQSTTMGIINNNLETIVITAILIGNTSCTLASPLVLSVGGKTRVTCPTLPELDDVGDFGSYALQFNYTLQRTTAAYTYVPRDQLFVERDTSPAPLPALIDLGWPCSSGAQCVSGFCSQIDLICTAGLQPDTCQNSSVDECVSGECGPSNTCLNPVGEPCSTADECAVNICGSNYLCGIAETNSGCADSSECQPGLTCTPNSFCTTMADGSYCADGTDCTGGFCPNPYDSPGCTNGVIGAFCNVGTDCQSGYCDKLNDVCSNGEVYVDSCDSGQDATDQCVSAYCDSDLCNTIV
jgi:hypothetical protein